MKRTHETTEAITSKIECDLCGKAPMSRCPGCGTPHCSLHAMSTEFCHDCQQVLDARTERVERVLAIVLGVLVMMVAVLAGKADPSIMSGLAMLAIGVPFVVLTMDLGGRVACALFTARRRQGRELAGDPAAEVMLDPVGGD